jgi:hypothetical protein
MRVHGLSEKHVHLQEILSLFLKVHGDGHKGKF